MKDNLEKCSPAPAFCMDAILAIPRGVTQQYNRSEPGYGQQLTLVVTDTMGIVDRTIVTDHETAPRRYQCHMPMVEMNFMLEGNARHSYKRALPDSTLKKGDHHLLFNPSGEETNQVLHGGKHRLFSVHLLPDYIAGLFSGYLPELMPLTKKIMKGEPFLLSSPTKAESNSFKHFFASFWDAPAAPGLGKLYFDSRILDLLCRQCEALIGYAPKEQGIKKADLEKVYHARNIVVNRLNSPLSLAELSRVCHLNEFKLKKYFKQVFNTSVFRLIQEERLKTAKSLICQGEKNISQIAYELGYAHPQHFQRAFKKRFGITPTTLLK